MIDKSIRADYVMQGKVRNYLGKQKMVKAPKKWKSGPDKPETELAYITKAEKDALVKMNLHGSMRGKAHKGPSGIISLNGWGDADRGTSDASYGGGNVSGSGDSRDYGGGAAAEARSARAAATQEASRVAAVNAARAEESARVAELDRQKRVREQEEAEAARVIKEKMQMAKRGYMKPILFPTKKKPTIYETSDTGPFNRDNVYQDKIRQAKSKIEFDPKLSLEEKADRNKILDDFVYKGTFVSEPKKYGVKNLVIDALLFGATGGVFGKGAQTGAKLFSGAKRGQKLAELVKPGITEDLLDRINLTPTKDRIIKQSIATGGQGEGAQQVVSGGGDVVTQKIKEFTGEKETQQTDSKRSQLLLLLKQLQQYDSQNRLNDRGKQYLARLMSFINQPLPGRNRDI